MSRQRLHELRVQYDVHATKLSELQKVQDAVVAEAKQLQQQRDEKLSMCTSVRSTLMANVNALNQLQDSNTTISTNIDVEKGIINKITSLLEQYNEHMPAPNTPNLIVEQVGEVAAFIDAIKLT
ncbi:hypothetical protein [Candidatus Tisiphia endosymbiont of Temnostethus pusillus]|uniref:hypothetical protein n=1 Tax=Candidatus Tisiphia endosymbiont of Temnostethus pusillus TaxID=3139335 RepID=UPI0035C880D9